MSLPTIKGNGQYKYVSRFNQGSLPILMSLAITV